jgi:cytochrome P450
MRHERTGRWVRTGRVLIRTRRARRDADAGAILRVLARGSDLAVGLSVRGQRMLLLLHPDLVGQLLVTHAADTIKGPGIQRTRPLLGDGLLTSEGDDHRRARRLVAPAFSPRRLTGYTTGFAERTEEHIGHWRDGQTTDMHEQMARLTLDIVGTTLLGVDLGADAGDVRAALESALDTFAGSSATLLSPGSAGRRTRRATTPGPPVSVPRASIHEIVEKIIRGRAEHLSEDRGDVVSALLGAAAQPDGLTPSEVHDHVITLLMAGHETTATALSWTMYLLGQHPAAERALHDELDQFGRKLPSFADLHGLSYTRAVITESMRLFPPAWIIGRTLTANADFAGWHATPGTIVGVSPLLLHHDPRWFPDPSAFDPRRWLDERREAVPRHAYLPFGAGQRSCIGEQFAWAEATTALAVICSRWSARTEEGHLVRPQYRVTMRPGNGLPMRLHARRPR